MRRVRGRDPTDETRSQTIRAAATASPRPLSASAARRFRGTRYNLPVEIILPPQYPYSPPRVFVRPTPDMMIKDRHRHVDANGVVFLPVLNEWGAHKTLYDVVEVVSNVFGADPPLFAAPPGSAPPPRPASQPPRSPPRSRKDAVVAAMQTRLAERLQSAKGDIGLELRVQAELGRRATDEDAARDHVEAEKRALADQAEALRAQTAPRRVRWLSFGRLRTIVPGRSAPRRRRGDVSRTIRPAAFPR